MPRIVVVGTQSSGKSSVLESIVGLDFLPRGDGVVTRRPLELRLNHTQEGTVPYAKFDEIPNVQFTNFSEVRNQINVLTDKIAGVKKNIVDIPIVLNIYSHTCPDLTLVDLPGITRIPLAGSDQPQNIEQITKNMIAKYAQDPRTIMLCVIPANADMTTSDGLQLARQLDTKGIRTLGVITKIDIMDSGVNAKRMITGQDVPLRLGYVGVKNRSQQDINNNMSVKEALERENMYFKTHPVYSTLPEQHFGTTQLTNRLSKLMFTYIRHTLPEMSKEIKDQMIILEEKIKDLGPSMPVEESQKVHLLWNMVNDLITMYKGTITGRYDSKKFCVQNIGKKELTAGAKIKMHFYNVYKSLQNYNACQDYTDADIEKAIMLHEGDSLPGFPSVDVFIYLLQPQLDKLREPALDLIQDIFYVLEQLAQSLVERVFQRFPSMIPLILEVINQVHQQERDKCRQIVEEIIDAEQNYLFTNDPDYLANRTDIVPPANDSSMNQNNQQQNSQNLMNKLNFNKSTSNSAYVREIRLRIDAYYKLVIRNVRDLIPKSVGFFLVKASQEKLQYELYSVITKNQQILTCLGEPERIVEERKSLNGALATMKNALKILHRDPEITNSVMQDDEISEEIRREQMMRKQQMQGRPKSQNSEINKDPSVQHNSEGYYNQQFQESSKNMNKQQPIKNPIQQQQQQMQPKERPTMNQQQQVNPLLGQNNQNMNTSNMRGGMQSTGNLFGDNKSAGQAQIIDPLNTNKQQFVAVK